MVCSVESSDLSVASQVQMVDVTRLLQGAEENYGSVEMASPTSNNEPSNSETQTNTRSRKKSMVWEYFTIETVGDGCTRACCKQCKKSFAYISGSKLAGTSHLKRHIALGICPFSRRSQENNEPPLYNSGIRTDGSKTGIKPLRKRYKGTPRSPSVPFNQDLCGHEIAKMIILHDYPLHIVENPGFVNFVRALQPQFNLLSFDAIQNECMSVYLTVKQSLLKFVGGIPGRVSLTFDLWTSVQSLGYVFVTGHFVDEDWQLHRHILNVIMVPSPDSEFALSHAVAACITDWNLDNRLFSLTLDESFANGTMREKLRCFLPIKNPLILNGQLLIGNCYARVLSHLAQIALGSMRDTIGKVRDSVKYVKTSEAHEEKFIELQQQLQIPSTKSVNIDDQTKWNTTYHMLAAASELKEVFSCLDTSDLDCMETPSMDEWRVVDALCKYLKLLFDGANILTAKIYPTANMFFHEVWQIQLELTHAVRSEDPFVRDLIKPLQEKFDKYWRENSLVLALAIVMDPRYKMKLVEFSFSRIYSEDAEMWIKIVDDSVHELYLDYIVLSLPPPTFAEEGNEVFAKTVMPQEENLLSAGDELLDFDVDISEISGDQQMKSELDQYLDEPLLSEVQDFDVLSWWKLNRLKYPTLSRMASDILSIPVSTVASDSVFSTVTVGKMDSYRSSLQPAVLEALVCAKDWLRYGFSDS